jgi:hypothetical protein
MQIQAECDDSNKYIQQWEVPDPYVRGMLVVKGVVVPVSQICGWWWRSPGMLVVKGAAVPVSQICGWWCRSPLEEAPQICRWRPL